MKIKSILPFTASLLLLLGCASSSSSTAPRSADGTYLCTACDLNYEDQAMAQKCYDWCTTQNSCNAEITQHAVGSVSSK